MTSPTSLSTALVLGGGGSTGNAWLIGVVAGLFDAGIDVSTADRIIGTSAGSTAAAQITGERPPKLLADILEAPPLLARGGPAATVTDHLQRMVRLVEAATDAADYRRTMGAAALERASGSDYSNRWRATVEPRLPSASWPPSDVVITAVNARTGESALFDRHSGVDLVDAVAASCSSGMAYAIGDDFYIDGGYRTNAENADLARGFERVLVLAPFGGASPVEVDWTITLAAQLGELRASGSAVELIVPGDESDHLFGTNAMNGALRPEAARLGYEQGRGRAQELAAFWPVGR